MCDGLSSGYVEGMAQLIPRRTARQGDHHREPALPSVVRKRVELLREDAFEVAPRDRAGGCEPMLEGR